MNSKKELKVQKKGNLTQALYTEHHENKMLTKAELDLYSEINPNFGKEYLQEIIENNKTVRNDLKHKGRNETIGLVTGVFVALGFIGFVVYCCFLGQIQIAAGLIATCLVGLVVSLVSRNKQKT